ncbi:hypothetical protein CK203_082849 [Vitis vinifera]|uniref:Uncharacterized protein n=1 Tax=Vitis vinifera TaxID=29760 RepID=A0A438D737_VITVI|nr:hypothetical protein CK203_082849 [Vitis vinifera]
MAKLSPSSIVSRIIPSTLFGMSQKPCKQYFKLNPVVWTPSCKSSSEASAQARHFSSLSRRSHLQLWMTYSSGNSKSSNQSRQNNKKRDSRQQYQPIKIDPTRQDWNRRCSYHKDHDHTIEQCKSLHYLVEKLIKAKYLKQYVRTTRKQREATPKAIVQAPASPKAPKVIINYIHEGSIDDKHSSRRQRRRLLYATSVRERINSVQHTFVERSVHPVDNTITFPPINVNRVLQLHEDALILTLGQMGYSPSNLENPGHLLSRFNGATTTSLGDVVLPIQVDPITLSVRFSMVDDLSPYNSIIGCVWLHKMKFIPSTYHQMVSYLIEEG